MICVPHAMQHEVMHRRCGIVTNSVLVAIPGLRRVISCRAAPGMTPAASLAPHRDRRGAFHHRPLVLVYIDDGVAVRRAAFPRGAEAVLRELPRPLALRAGLVLRLARDFAVG